MVPNKYNMVDMDGIDIVYSQGLEVPGLYGKLVESHSTCRYTVLYNWFFNNIPLAPYYEELVLEVDSVKIGTGITVTSDDIVHVYSLEIEQPMTELSASENGDYVPPTGYAGFDSVHVNVQPPLEEISITENGTYFPSIGRYGFSKVTVDISGSGVLVGTTDPTDDIGEDGDYYYKRGFPGRNGCTFGQLSSSGTTRSGYEFIATEDSVIIGLRGFSRSNITGGLVLAEADGTVIVEIDNITFSAGTWTSVELTNPVQLISGNHYIVQIIGASGALSYASKNSSIFNSITFVNGKYGPLPGTNDPSNVYGADIIMIESSNYVVVKSQFYKENSHWEQIG